MGQQEIRPSHIAEERDVTENQAMEVISYLVEHGWLHGDHVKWNVSTESNLKLPDEWSEINLKLPDE